MTLPVNSNRVSTYKNFLIILPDLKRAAYNIIEKRNIGKQGG